MVLLKKDFLSLIDFTRSEIEEIIDLALQQKSLLKAGKLNPILKGKTIACIFHKPSLRTRVSFERAMHQLGGEALYITEREIGIGTREEPRDIARVLSRYVSAVLIRTFKQETVDILAEWAEVPVINGLTDLLHPCQVLADLLTIKEKRGELRDITIAFIGDGNNVARSWVNASSIFGFKFILACPKGYGIEREFYERALGVGSESYREVNDPTEAVSEADVLYTDVWASMGQEDDAREKKKHFSAFQINKDLLDRAPSPAMIMHCLPAHRGEEITDEVMESPKSVVFDQAENRLHAQRALLSLLLSPERR